jgi:hypothetical protein
MSPKTGSTDRGLGVEAVKSLLNNAEHTIEWSHLGTGEHANPVLLAALKAIIAVREKALGRDVVDQTTPLHAGQREWRSSG